MGYQELAQKHLPLAGQIAHRLARRYGWVGIDDLHSYAYLGLTLAAKAYDASRGVPFERFACAKAMYLAIDEMRKAGILRRADATPVPETSGQEIELPDPHADRQHQRMEAREFCSQLLSRLSESERQLVMMIYVDKLAYRDIAQVFGISESAICLRHKAVLDRLRQQASVRQIAA
jgi:RNA polymerase sigma factor (sigma-70 family)